MHPPTSSRWTLVVALVAITALTAAVVALVDWRADRQLDAASGPAVGACEFTAAEHRTALEAPVTPGAPGLVLVVGDSYSQGAGLPTGRAGAFPALLAQRTGRPVHLDGFSSTGYTTRGFCADRPVSYGERLTEDQLVQLSPTTVVVEGGVNDAHHGDPGRVHAAAAELLARLSAVPQVVVVGPATVLSAAPEALDTVDAALARAARAAGRQYVGLRRQSVQLQVDGVHPTDAGQRLVADLVAPLLAPLPAA